MHLASLSLLIQAYSSFLSKTNNNHKYKTRTHNLLMLLCAYKRLHCRWKNWKIWDWQSQLDHKMSKPSYYRARREEIEVYINLD